MYATTGQGVLGNNMFAYCCNNPVNMADPTGEIAITTLILIGSAIIGAACAGYTAYVEYNAGCDTTQIIGDSICAGVSGFCLVYSMGMSAYQCYQNYCYLNGLTPAANIGQSSTFTQAPTNPLESIEYTQKVENQRQQGDYHSFPNIVDNYGSYGYQETITGGDGSTYTKLSIPGAYGSKTGYFVYIWDENNICNHRLFEPK